jgi:tRNA 2-thiouridine synthesizing protein A
MLTRQPKAALTLDLAGLNCPLPGLKVRKALSQLPQGAVLEALCTDPLAEIDIPELTQNMQARLLSRQKTLQGTLFRIEKA